MCRDKTDSAFGKSLKKIGDRMINDATRYLSRSCENFSNIILLVAADNGISILTGADKR
jgi:hypothetical protein